jgi:N-methylhydantoinase A
MIGIDVGGTFTDIVSLENGVIQTRKVASRQHESYRSVLEGAMQVDLAGAATFNHASTHGLNAIITRRLPKVGFLTTDGHRDVLDMANSWRPAESLTDCRWSRTFSDAREPIVPRYLRRGIHERMTAGGETFLPLDETQAREQLQVLGECAVEGVAICLLNAYVNPAHERRLLELVREELGDIACSVSSSVSPLAREYERASTTVVDVLMKIIYGPYTELLDSGLRENGFDGQLYFADCAAMLSPASHAMKAPSRIVFSGPAAGTVACSHLGAAIGELHLICADVGGTSCDISVVIDGDPSVQTTFELEHDLIVSTLSMEISSIGAGGGSVVWISPAGEVRVGPRSAGADPGPACYGRGGTEPTTTDVCLLMGILDPDRFAGRRLDVDRARSAFDALDSVEPVDGLVRTAYQMGISNLSEGVFNTVIKSGIDPRDYSLVAYGAAGPMLLPALLDSIRVKSVIVPPHAGLFSALGLLSADQVFADSVSSYTLLHPDAADRVNDAFAELERRLLERLAGRAAVTLERSFDGQLVGQAWDTPFVAAPGGHIGKEELATMITAFHDHYEARSGNRFEDMPILAVTLRVRAILPTEKLEFPELPQRQHGQLSPRATVTLHHLADEPVDAAEYEREDLYHEDVIKGPAIVREPLGTTLIHAGQIARVGRVGELVITAS